MSMMTVERALESLKEGNKRFSSGKSEHPRQGHGRRAEIAGGQHPFVAIVACSDSRVAPEIIFDQGLGDLFVVRCAGNLIDEIGLASIEYAVEHLDVPLVVVMGHSRCGAITAAVQKGAAPGHLSRVVSALDPVVERAKALGGDLADNASRENVRAAGASLESSEPLLRRLVDRGDLLVAGAFYDVESGVVEFFE